MFSIGRRIREVRMKKGLTQMDLARGLCTPSMISQVESDRAKPSYKILFAIAERLGVPLEQLLGDVELNLEAISTYKMARAMVAHQQYESAAPLLQELLKHPRGIYPTSDITMLLAECYLHTQQFLEAEQLFTEVEERAVFRQDHELLAHALFGMSRIELCQKRYHVTIFRLEKALAAMDKLEAENVYLQAKILYHLGQAYSKSGQGCEAQMCYERALTLYRDVDRLPEIGRVYLDLSQTHKQLQHLERAVMYAEQAEAVFRALHEIATATQLQVHAAVLLGQNGREEEAVSLLEASILKLRDLDLRTEEGMAAVELAKIRSRLGDWASAQEACYRASHLLPDRHIGQVWVYRLLGRVALANGSRQEAIHRFTQAADLCMTTGEVGEWDDVMQEIASLYAADQEMDKAYATLLASHEHIQGMLLSRGIVL